MSTEQALRTDPGDACPDDPVGEGTHWFGDDDLCRYCGQRDPLTLHGRQEDDRDGD